MADRARSPTRRNLGLSQLASFAVGLLVGLVAGVVLLSVFRSRPRPPREIRLTITPNDLPQRRASTLAMDDAQASAIPVERGRPMDAASLAISNPTWSRAVAIRTDVPVPAGSPGPAVLADLVALPVVHEPDPLLSAIRQHAEARVPVGVATGGDVGGTVTERPRAQAEPSAAGGSGRSASAGAASGSSAPAPPTVAAGPCVDERRIATERCDLAERLTEQAAVANQLLRDQQRAYDDLTSRTTQAAQVADPREVRAAKEVARQTFRKAHAAARSRAEGESAAADWLTEINRVNQAAREAGLESTRLRKAAALLAVTIERLGLDADVARINAESAAESCHVAREALAACEEAQVDRRAGRVPVDPAAVPVEPAWPRLIGGPEFETDQIDGITPPSERAFAGAQPRILRMLRGDSEAMRTVVRDVAGEDPAEQRRWQLLLSNLVDACVARAIEASSLEFPAEHSFWGPFSEAQNRDIATALASLGYRFDGLGGFSDGRIPSQRDLSLALGYAGLDPMRLRTWPTEATMPHLFEDVRVAADEYVAGAAGDLTLGEMVALLRGRAEPLADLWNNWGKVRPLLLEA